MIKFLLATILLLQQENEVLVTNYQLSGKTATGQWTKDISEPFVAVSRDLLDQYPLDSHILLYHCEWEGIYVVKDKMGRRHKNSIDVYSPAKSGGFTKCKCKKIP